MLLEGCTATPTATTLQPWSSVHEFSVHAWPFLFSVPRPPHAYEVVFCRASKTIGAVVPKSRQAHTDSRLPSCRWSLELLGNEFVRSNQACNQNMIVTGIAAPADNSSRRTAHQHTCGMIHDGHSLSDRKGRKGNSPTILFPALAGGPIEHNEGALRRA